MVKHTQPIRRQFSVSVKLFYLKLWACEFCYSVEILFTVSVRWFESVLKNPVADLQWSFFANIVNGF